MNTLSPGSSWALQQLAGLLAGISSYDDEAAMLQGAVHRMAEAVDAEVCALVTNTGTVPVAIGFPAGAAPTAELNELVDAGSGAVHVDGLGALAANVLGLGSPPEASFVVARSTSALTADDLHLLRSMSQVVSLALQLRRTADRERQLRLGSERQAAALARANDDLLAASEAKDLIISVASHELRTPLTSIIGFAGTLRTHGEQVDPADRQKFLGVIERQGERLLSLIDDLLAVGRLESGQMAPRSEPVSVVNRITDTLRSHPTPVSITGDAAIEAIVDPGHLDQLVLNLVTNAEKYGAAPITVEVEVVDGGVEVAVVDRGAGVPVAFVPHLFERFSQASTGESRQSTGTGLGLAIVAGLAEANDASIRYERVQDRTRFVILLRPAEVSRPAVAGDPHDRRSHDRASAPAPRA